MTEGSPPVNEDTYYSTATDAGADSRVYLITVGADRQTEPSNEDPYYSTIRTNESADARVYCTVGDDRQTEPEPPVGTAAASVNEASSDGREKGVESPLYLVPIIRNTSDLQ